MIFHIDMLFQMSCKGFAPMLCTEAWKSNPLSKIAEHLSVWIWHLRGLVVAGFPPGHKHQEAKVSRRVWLRFLVPRYYVWFVFETLSRFTDTWVSEVRVWLNAGSSWTNSFGNLCFFSTLHWKACENVPYIPLKWTWEHKVKLGTKAGGGGAGSKHLKGQENEVEFSESNTKWSFSIPTPSPTTFLWPLGLHCLKRRWLTSARWMRWATKSEFRQAISAGKRASVVLLSALYPSIFRRNGNYLLRTCGFYF